MSETIDKSFVQKFVRANIKDPNNAQHYCTMVRGDHRWAVDRANNAESVAMS